ncbi:MAG: hypothetical protein EZS26_000491 [Candidatus Ordinivivax streblomastigis]|uniref:HTH cro/C1-type domain-containing protein n=1 Tax=Candidatus Ordinivivax streblomastigis TaxID=2540710 RepID=A0A5M8P4S0_9BACT|nr:MAG: hypothetical protein EZS26_000476 [Candidatus Ordinivivax streblomastigis]KAA6303331.1 MAG: hypothetical protein EZS26_000491 [Candidatus Ordinivivax streblomastigis]
MITIPGRDPKMIANNLEPYYPTHPGEILKEEIEYRGISQRKLAAEMGVSYTVLNEILNAKSLPYCKPPDGYGLHATPSKVNSCFAWQRNHKTVLEIFPSDKRVSILSPAHSDCADLTALPFFIVME